jgi:transglutaminase-like putative cysteine protease
VDGRGRGGDRERAGEEGVVSTRFLLQPSALPLLRLAPAAAAGVLLAVIASTTNLPALARGFAIALIVVSVLVSIIPKREDVKTHGSVTAAIVSVAATGQTHGGAAYVVACALFAMVVLACLRAPLVAARMRAGERIAPPSPRTSALLVLGVASAAVVAALVFSLPPLSAMAERQVQRMAGNVTADDDHVGFNTKLRVGSLRHMLKGDRVVMRVSGEPVEYLRGAVVDRYDLRVWSSTQAAKVVEMPADAPVEQSTTRIELSRAALSGRIVDPRWFLPEDACDVRTPSGRIGLDAHGAAHPIPAVDAREVSFRRSSTGTCTVPTASELEPNRTDLAIAAKLLPELRSLALSWTNGAATERAALAAIMHELAAYPYSLEDRREGEIDPVVEFLRTRHGGHCELFASAMALLARSIGIPTRLAVGYRVDEVNAITGLSVVRDRNAHTWVEAFVDGRWQSFDPTPFTELHGSTRPSRWDHFAEAISFAWDRTIGFFANVGLARTGIFSGVVAVVLIIVRRFLQRRAVKTQSLTAASRPLPAFESLASALARAGWERIPSEPLERFARRVDEAGEPWSADVAEALVRYAELRYGGIGEERTVAQRLDALARKVAPTS